MSDIFSPDAIAKSVHATLDAAYAAIPDGKAHAIIFDGTASTEDGPAIRALYVQRAPDGWNVVLEGGYSGPGGVSGQVAVAKAW